MQAFDHLEGHAMIAHCVGPVLAESRVTTTRNLAVLIAPVCINRILFNRLPWLSCCRRLRGRRWCRHRYFRDGIGRLDVLRGVYGKGVIGYEEEIAMAEGWNKWRIQKQSLNALYKTQT